DPFEHAQGATDAARKGRLSGTELAADHDDVTPFEAGTQSCAELDRLLAAFGQMHALGRGAGRAAQGLPPPLPVRGAGSSPRARFLAVSARRSLRAASRSRRRASESRTLAPRGWRLGGEIGEKSR